MLQLLLSPSGRLSRRTYWIVALGFGVLHTIALAIDVAGGAYSTVEDQSAPVGSIVTLILLWPSIALLVKRAHDRGRGWWFLLLLLVPILNVWPIISMLFCRGQEGANRFGDDPYEKKPIWWIWAGLIAIWIIQGYLLQDFIASFSASLEETHIDAGTQSTPGASTDAPATEQQAPAQ